MKTYIPIPKPEAKWTNENLAIMELNTKAHYTLTSIISRNIYNKIYKLKTVKEIWDSQSINYEGTNDVQLRKVVTLMLHYENFCMKGESMDDMFRRLQVVLNGLEALGHTFSKAHINMKILNNFTKVREPRTTTIQKARNLKTLA